MTQAIQPVEQLKDLPDTDQTSNKNLTETPTIARLIALRRKGLTYEEIGQLVNRTRETVWKRLQPYADSIDTLPTIKEYRADTLAVVSDRIINSISQDDIDKSSGYQKVGMYSLLRQNERLDRGEATDITTYKHDLSEMHKWAALARERGLLDAIDVTPREGE